MKQLVLLFGILLCFVWMGCGSAQDFCGEGTQAQDGKCIPNYPKKECASGTVDEQGQCKPAFEKIECGEGTSPKDGQCVPDYEKRECGSGTTSKDGQCVPTFEKVTCGQGTKQDEGQCLPEKTLSCSDGTREENGQCIPDDPKELCGPGKVLLGGQCLTARSQWIRLPFEEGFSVTISQGHHGSFSHKGNSAYSVDFGVPEGTKVVAVRAGIVIGTKSDSDSGCGDSSCSSQANYVYIDHGDGTSARYLHLQKDGVRVKLGEQVCPGQVIGLSGNTGFSTGPHLHLEILDGLNLSQPIYFEALRDTSAGVAYPGLRVTSPSKGISFSKGWRPLPNLQRAPRVDSVGEEIPIRFIFFPNVCHNMTHILDTFMHEHTKDDLYS